MTACHDFLADAAGVPDARAMPPIGTAVAAEDPDTELLAACAAMDELEWAICATGFDHEPESPADLAADAERDRLSAAQEAIVDRMTKLRAMTREGQAARARSLALWKPRLMWDNPSGTIDERLTYAVLRDLIGEAVR